MSMKLGILTILGAFLWGLSGKAFAQPQLPQPLCLLLNGVFRTLLPETWNIQEVTLPLDLGSKAMITFYAENIAFTGMKDITFENCTADAKLTYISNTIKNLTVDIGYYNVTGQLAGHLDVYGSGPASIRTDDFFFAIYGNYTSTIPGFDYLQVDLAMYRWAVNFEGFMDGTDMQPLFNEFMSMVGPETLEALQGLLNNKYNKQLTDIINKILFKIIASPP